MVLPRLATNDPDLISESINKEDFQKIIWKRVFKEILYKRRSISKENF